MTEETNWYPSILSLSILISLSDVLIPSALNTVLKQKKKIIHYIKIKTIITAACYKLKDSKV